MVLIDLKFFNLEWFKLVILNSDKFISLLFVEIRFELSVKNFQQRIKIGRRYNINFLKFYYNDY